MINLRMNKRGDVTITLLVIGVFAICTLALASFYYSSAIVRDPSLGLNSMEKMNSQLEKYSSPQGLHDKFENFLEIETDAQGNRFFILEELDGDKKKFHVKYYLE